MRFNDIMGKRVFIRRDKEISTITQDGAAYTVETSGFDGVVTEIDGDWIFVSVADEDPVGFNGIWVNRTLQREIAILK